MDQRREDVHITESRGGAFGTTGIGSAKVEQHSKITDATGTRKEDFERKSNLGGGEKVEHHIREDAGNFGGRKVDYERKDDPSTGTHKVDYHASEGNKDEGLLDKAGRKLGLKK